MIFRPSLSALLVAGLGLGFGATPPMFADESLVVHAADVIDVKAVIATVWPAHELVARARIGGTIASLSIKEGDTVAAGAVVAEVADAKLALQMQALASRIAALTSTRDQAKIDFGRIALLARSGANSQAQREQAQEGAVLAPGAARVLTGPASLGRVVPPGETIATAAEDQYVLRLRLPYPAGDPGDLCLAAR